MLSYGRFSYVPFLCSIFGDIHPKIGVYATTFSFYLLRTTENGRFFSEFEISKTLFQKPLNRGVLATLLLALSLTLKREQEFLSLRRSRSQLL